MSQNPPSKPCHRYRLLLAYDGAPFRGFARQPGLPTVQGKLETALSRVLREELRTSAAGRTDAGVHALGQVVSFETSAPLEDPADLGRRLNAMLGPEIAVLETAPAHEAFDARFSCLSRTYEYAILNREVHDPFSRHTAWHHPGPLDVASMRRASQALVGEHDFSSFGRVPEGKSPIRRVESMELEQEGQLLVVRVTANSFIQQMVRSIVGTLVKVGEGREDPDRMGDILRAADRAAAGPVAPPHGLFLVSASYPSELLQ
jgi:tRNA pseudouridine38-40 synthase